jgi:hypothetical protein
MASTVRALTRVEGLMESGVGEALHLRDPDSRVKVAMPSNRVRIAVFSWSSARVWRSEQSHQVASDADAGLVAVNWRH